MIRRLLVAAVASACVVWSGQAPAASALMQNPWAAEWGKGPIQAPTSTSEKISIFVAPQTRDGFVDVDRGVLDSIEDLKAQFRGKKRLRIVDDRDHARLVLEVVSRGATSTAGGGAAAMPIGASTFLIPFGTIGIATVLRVGSYEKPIVFQNCQEWRHCARLVAKDVDMWLEANASAVASK